MNIKMENETLRRIKGFTRLADGEVGGMARVAVINKTPYVYDLRLLPNQEVTGASIKVNNPELALFLSTVERPDEFKFLWHSHVNMQAMLSNIDQVCIDGFLETSPFLISCISSKKGEIFVQFDSIINDIRISQNCTIKTISETYDDLKEELSSHIININDNYFCGFEEDNNYNNNLLKHELIPLDDFIDRNYGNSSRNIDLFSNIKNIDINVFKMKEDIDNEK